MLRDTEREKAVPVTSSLPIKLCAETVREMRERLLDVGDGPVGTRRWWCRWAKEMVMAISMKRLRMDVMEMVMAVRW